MRTVAALVTCAVVVTFVIAEESSENVHISGSFRVAAEGEELPGSIGQVEEHPFFQLEGMKIARAYLDRQYAKEREQISQKFVLGARTRKAANVFFINLKFAVERGAPLQSLGSECHPTGLSFIDSYSNKQGFSIKLH